MIQRTSIKSYYEQKKPNKTQEEHLYRLFVTHPEGLTDRQVADAFNWAKSHAAARRNGLIKALAKQGERLGKLGTTKDALTGKTVIVWGLIRENVQGNLFYSESC